MRGGAIRAQHGRPREVLQRLPGRTRRQDWLRNVLLPPRPPRKGGAGVLPIVLSPPAVSFVPKGRVLLLGAPDELFSSSGVNHIFSHESFSEFRWSNNPAPPQSARPSPPRFRPRHGPRFDRRASHRLLREHPAEAPQSVSGE